MTLESMLRVGAGYRRRLIITESVFSMDGDLAPLVELADLADRFDCMLLVDEAHATGVFGGQGRGLAEEMEVEDRIAVASARSARHWARPEDSSAATGAGRMADQPGQVLCFSTALPPAVCMRRWQPSRSWHGARAANRTRPSPGRFRDASAPTGLESGGQRRSDCAFGGRRGVGGNAVGAALSDPGILAPAIRPPSVPEDNPLVRISLSHPHTSEMVERLVAALSRCGPSAPWLSER